jgi:hypothetical protein
MIQVKTNVAKKQSNKIPTVVIDVKKWGRQYYKCEKTGKMCVLGFVKEQEPALEVILDQAVIDVNDHMYGKERREALRALFKKAGARLIFKNVGKFRLPKKAK